MKRADDLDADQCVLALKLFFERVHYAGDPLPIGPILSLVGNLPPGDSWARQEYEAVRDGSFERARRGEAKQLDLLLVGGRFHLFNEGPDQRIRPSRPEDLTNPAKVPGATLVAGRSNPNLVRRGLAHNYCLSYPERAAVLKHFPCRNPGADKESAISPAVDAFVMHRKVNQVIAAAAFSEGKTLEIVVPAGDGFALHVRPPAPLIAAVAVDAFMTLSGGNLSAPVEYEALADEFGFVLPRELLLGSWRRELSAPVPLLTGEAGDTRVRLEPAAFTYLLECGMVDPLHVSRVLLHGRAKKSLEEARKFLAPEVMKDEPRNAAAYLRHFDWQAGSR